MLHLQAEVTAQADVAEVMVDVGLDEGGRDLFVHVPGFRHQVAGGVGRRERHVLGDHTWHVPRRNHAGANEAEVNRCVQQVRRNRRWRAVQVDVAFWLTLFLGTVGDIEADIDTRQEALGSAWHWQRSDQLEALQLVFHAWHLAVARTVDRVTHIQVGRVAVVTGRIHLREAAVAEAQGHGIEQGRVARTSHLQIVFQAQLVALGFREVHVGDQGPVAEVEVVRPA
ncbi:hypothetical protein LP420_27890 [Massilia sp. B-10]|nr:hypothetical protein LP420_27890 [Massilia sp. B-10]